MMHPLDSFVQKQTQARQKKWKKLKRWNQMQKKLALEILKNVNQSDKGNVVILDSDWLDSKCF